MTTATASLSVVVPVKNDAVRLARCLAAIAGNSVRPAEVIVVDNGSTDTSADVARAAGCRVLVMPDGRVSELRNRAAAVSRQDYLAFIDADHEVVAGWVEHAGELLSADTAAGAAGAVYSAPVNGTWVQRIYGALRGATVGRGDVAWLGSGNLVVRRTAFDAIGGFDASLEACEDVDFCRRLRAAGWRLVGDERLRSVHLGDPPSLGAVFRAERWRGRNNIAVTLRGPLSLRDLPSLCIPIVELIAGAAAVLALVTLPFVDAPLGIVLLVAASVIVGITGARVAAAAWRGRLRTPLDWLKAFAVALAYDSGRAVALVTRAGHHRQPAGAGASAVKAASR